MGSYRWNTESGMAGRLAALVCVVASCIGGAKAAPITMPDNARLFRTSYGLFPDATAVPPDSSGQYYVYDETDDEVITVVTLTPGMPFRFDGLPRGHRYRVYYLPRVGGPATRPAGETLAVGQQAREVADKLTWLTSDCAIWPWRNFGLNTGSSDPNSVLMRRLLDTPYAIEEALPLLQDADPKVRSVGIAMVFHVGGAPAANTIASLLDDDATAFRQSMRTATGPFMREQKVKDQAIETVGRHLAAAGRVIIYSQPDVSRKWRSYWPLRKDHPYGAADFVLALDRATQSSLFIAPRSIPAINQVGDEVRRLPMPDRFLILHQLWYKMGGRFRDNPDTHIATQKELLALARQLSPELRRAVGRKERITDDPDQCQNDGPLGEDRRKMVGSID
ncbi:MAG: hypothetical protein ACHRHE_02295 [Tepidisphaerales bacterium]